MPPQNTGPSQPNNNTSIISKVWRGFTNIVGYFDGSKSGSDTFTNDDSKQTTPPTVLTMRKNVNMNALVLAQNADGAWVINGATSEQLFGSDLTSRGPEGVDQDVWMTLICIAYLTIVCSQHKSEWELIVQKAENWLKNVGANKSEWNQHAKQLIQQNQN